jgi:hypothetical protein
LIHYLIINWTHCDSQNDLLNIGSIFSVTPNQIERLYSRFTSLDRGNSGTLSREDLLRIPELAINPLGDRIVHAFFQEGTGDSINFLQFMQVLAHFRPIKKNKDTKLNSREQKLKCNILIIVHIRCIEVSLYLFAQLLSKCMIWTATEKFPVMSCWLFCR